MTELIQTTVRLAVATDAKRVAELCCQLGYSASQAEVQQRLEQIRQDERHAVYVAERSDGWIVGWVHTYVCQLIITHLQAEIGGLIVDESCRGYGIGQLLMQHVEQWACERGCRAVYVRSNIVRRNAHIFYERMGYSNIKTSLAFHKVL